MKLTGLAFKAVANSKNGSPNAETIMRFTSDEPVIVANYGGGTIVAGHAPAKRLGLSELEMLYQGATTEGQMRADQARAQFRTNGDGRLSMFLEWPDLEQGLVPVLSRHVA